MVESSMMQVSKAIARLVRDLAFCFVFFTRLPVPVPVSIAEARLASSIWAVPLAGLAVAVLSAAAYALALALGLVPGVAAALGLAVGVVATGGLHEDGLADTADGFGGGSDRERKLLIMRDSRIGTYGACALVLGLLMRWSSLAAIAEPLAVLAALVASHTAARAILPGFMHALPPARAEGLSANAGMPTFGVALTAAILGAVALFLCLGLQAGFVVLALLSLAALAMGWLCRRQVGGQTGDILGALEQGGEVIVLLVVVAMRT